MRHTVMVIKLRTAVWGWCACALVIAGSTAARAEEVPTTRPVDGLREHNAAAHALVGARVVVAPGNVLDKATVVVRDGVITAVGSEVAVPGDARVWNMAGKTIYAGLIDAFGEQAVGDEVARTGSPYWNPLVVPHLQLADHYRADSGLQEKLRRQGVTTRLVAPSGGIIKGWSVLVGTGDDDNSRTIVQPRVAQHLRLTIARGGRNAFPNSPMGAVALARQAMLDAQWYRDAWLAHRTQPTLAAPERNDALESLQHLAGAGDLVIADASDEQFVLRADRFAREFNLRLAIRGSGREYRRLDAIRALDRPLIIPVDFPKPPDVVTAEAALNASYDELMHWDYAPENPARLEKAGVRFALTSHGLKEPADFLNSVRKAVERGLSSDAALRAVTTTPAELFGASQRLGSIERGKLASFVVTDGDLFRKETKIHATWVLGRPYEIIKPPLIDVAGTWKLQLGGGGKVAPSTIELRRTDAGDLQGEIVLPPSPPPAPPAEAKPSDAKPAPEPAAKPADKPEEKPATKPDEKPPEKSAEKPAEKPAEKSAEKPAEKPAEKSTEKPAEEKKPVGEKIGLQHLALRDRRLTAMVDGEKLGTPGKAHLSVVVATAPDGSATWLGTWLWPDGNRVSLEARRDPVPAAPPTKPEERAASKSPDKPVPAASFPINYPLGAFGRPAAPEQDQPIVFQHATIWTCGPDGVLEDASLVIAGGKITAVGREVPIPAGARVVDARGKHLSPGIIDCHSHMATDGGINESTQAITAEVRIGDFIDATDVTIYRQLAGGVTSAHILHGSANPIGGQCQLIKLRWGELPEAMKFAEAPATIKFALGENVKQSNWGATATGRYPQSRMGVEQLFHDEFQAARAYQQRWQEWERDHRGLPPRRDLELEAIAEIIQQRRWIHCHSYRQDEILALLRTMELHGVRVQTLQHILEGYKVADAMARHGATGSAFSDWWAYKFEVFDAIPYNGALMHRAGIVVSFNSDDREMARHLNHEAAKAVKYGGVPPVEALKFVTLNPARQLMVDRYVGSLEAGKQADVVLWNGPPLSTLSRCEQTWVDGRKYFDRDEDRTLRDEAVRRRAVLVQKILSSGEGMREPGESIVLEREQWTRDDEFCIHHDHPRR